MNTNAEQSIRDKVSEFYAGAIAKPGSGCGCGATAVPKGVAAQVAGYDAAALAELPPDAVANSFGCGNPLAFAELRAGDVVLDLGSGAGIDILLAAKHVGPSGRAIGVDMTDDMIARANENIAAAGLSNVEVRKGIIEELPVEDGSVDWVISNCVINLSPEKDRVFAEIARVLKPGGRVRISDIVAQSLPEAARTSEALYGSCIAGAISEADYVAGLKAAGLDHVEVTERIVYDTAQLRAFLRSEGVESGCCGSVVDLGMPIDEMVSAMEGKIWSARFHARKAV